MFCLPKTRLASDFATDSVLGIPLFVIVAVVIVAAVALMLWKTRFGRQIYAVGSNAEAAAILGIHSRTVTFAVFALALSVAYGRLGPAGGASSSGGEQPPPAPAA